jgi:hypothetical protein
MKKILVMALLAAASIASASTTTVFNALSGVCGTATGGRCTVYVDTVETISYYWASSGNVQLSIYNADGLLVDTYTGNVGSNPLDGFTNAVLADVLGNTVSVSATMHLQRVLIRSGHNYYVYRAFVDSGSVTQ